MIQDLGIVYAAEIARRIKSRPFIVGLVVGVIGIMLLARLPQMMDKAFSNTKAVVLVGDANVTAEVKPYLQKSYTIARTLPAQPVDADLLERNDAGAAIVVSRTGERLHVTVDARDPGKFSQKDIADELEPLALQLATHRSAAQIAQITNVPVTVAPIASKFTSASQADAVRGIAYTMLFFLYLLILLNSQLVMSSVAEEKTSRIAELLVASVNPSALLTGKILASATLGILQLIVWVATASFLNGGGSTGGGSDSSTGLFSLASALDVITPTTVAAFLIFFIIGFLQLSTLFAAAASLINRTEDMGSLSLPLVMPVVAAFIIAISALGAPDSPLAVLFSYIPLLAPFVMFARIAVSDVPLWQIAVSLAINLAALYLIAIFAGKVYRVGMLMYGRAPSLKQVWSVIRS
jgi:ABC-2 type transport system permease protein